MPLRQQHINRYAVSQMFLILNNNLQAHGNESRDDNLFFPMRNIQYVSKFNVQIIKVTRDQEPMKRFR